MKKNVFLSLLYILGFLIISLNNVISAVKALSPDINDLPEGKFFISSFSPEESSRVDFYIVKNSMGTAVRGEKVEGDSHTNIYWQTGIDSVNVKWLDEYGVVINEIPLNLNTDKFDSRRGTAIFSDGVLAEKITENDKKSDS